jgi:hypothetical protein
MGVTVHHGDPLVDPGHIVTSSKVSRTGRAVSPDVVVT